LWEDEELHGVTKLGGDAEFVSPQGGGGGAERSSVGPFRETVEGHVWGKGEDREVVGTAQTKEGTLHVCIDRVGKGSVWVGETDVTVDSPRGVAFSYPVIIKSMTHTPCSTRKSVQQCCGHPTYCS
jgi:hypothetical protein